MFRQGDVLLIPVDSIPAPFKYSFSASAEPEGPIVQRYEDRVILAHGEKTGHVHQIKSRAAEVTRAGGARFLKLGEPATLVHDEHGPIHLPVGIFRVRQQREWDGIAALPVGD